MQPKNPNYQAMVTGIFDQAPFIQWTGMRLVSVEPGRVRTVLDLEERHNQQNGFVHAGIQATIADHTAGAAAGSLVAADEIILSVEFKVNLLRPAKGVRLHCTAEVLKAGRTLIITESEVHAEAADGSQKLVSKATVTLAVVPAA